MEDGSKISVVLVGIGFGTALGLLLAPKSGAEARHYVQSKSRGAADRLKREGQSLYERGKDGFQTAQRQVQDQIKRFSRAADTGRLAFRKALNET